MLTLYKHNIRVARLNSLAACLKYIGINKTIQQAIAEGWTISNR